MSELISDPRYWKRRLDQAHAGPKPLHHSIYVCAEDYWKAGEAKHRDILLSTIRSNDSILDAGCGYGRLLDLLPTNWKGAYLGVDLSPDFIQLARKKHPAEEFMVSDLRELVLPKGYAVFDWAILISIRPMVQRHLGGAEWDKMEAALRRCAKKLLYLEYDPMDEGSVE